MAGSASGQDKQILCSDWLLKRVTCMARVPCSHGFLTMAPREKVLGEIKKKKTCNELQTTKEKEREISPAFPNLNSLSVPKSVRFSGLENGKFLFKYSHPFSLSLSSNSFTLALSICAR